jgi:uncharacterized membrane protein YhaH (DUF805 family)
MKLIDRLSSGRIGRLTLLSITMIFFCSAAYCFIVLLQPNNTMAETVLNLAAIVTLYILSVFYATARYHDLGQSGKQAWKLFLPGYNLYLWGVLFLKKGDEEANAWEEAKYRGWKIRLFSLLPWES